MNEKSVYFVLKLVYFQSLHQAYRHIDCPGEVLILVHWFWSGLFDAKANLGKLHVASAEKVPLILRIDDCFYRA